MAVRPMDHYRLLHVEDDPIDVRLFGLMLAELQMPGGSVCHASSVSAALEALEAEPPDLVFLDLDLPDSGGLETVERVLGASGDVPVVVLTGNGDERVGERAVALGAQDYLVKDAMHAPALGRVLRYAIERQRALGTAKRESARAAAAEARLEATEAAREELELEAAQRKEAQERLEASLAQLQALRGVDAAIIADSPLSQILDHILGAFMPLVPVEAAAFSLVRERELSLVASRGLGAEEALPPLSLDDAAVAEAWRDGYAARALGDAVPDDPGAFGRLAIMRRGGLVAYRVLALTVRERPVGVLELFSREPASTARPEWLPYVETHGAQAAAAIDASRLRSRLVSANDEILAAYDNTIRGWSRALDLRDHETRGHSGRVATMAVRLGRALGVAGEELSHLRRGALLHDIGKMAVPDSILLKPGPLDPYERTIMERHTVFARDLLAPISFLRPALDVPYAHHERWDGSGYPRGLAGEEIPLAARIFAVADVYDALTSDRPYRPAWSRQAALDHVLRERERHFDPVAAETFVRLVVSAV